MPGAGVSELAADGWGALDAVDAAVVGDGVDSLDPPHAATPMQIAKKMTDRLTRLVIE
ncbi:MAG: hypothetical protein ACXWD3_17145 [Mycobacterium sp.]